jgi:alpha-1,3/alpha-1,6-mannosyltransferase
MKVAFAHLDLGIGGAEALVVSAALAAAKKGHEVLIFTTHHDKTHCFAQTRDDGVLANSIVVIGDWLPRSLFGRAIALCSSIRMCYLSACMLWKWSGDVVFCDGVSTQIPILRLRFPVLFYCHFPDLLLCTQRSSLLKRIYRAPLDWLETETTGWANMIVVNSRFTAEVFKAAFPKLQQPSMYV